jgi:hypothetical protein
MTIILFCIHFESKFLLLPYQHTHTHTHTHTHIYVIYVFNSMKVSFNWISLPALCMNKCIFTWTHTQNTAERHKGEGKQGRNYISLHAYVMRRSFITLDCSLYSLFFVSFCPYFLFLLFFSINVLHLSVRFLQIEVMYDGLTLGLTPCKWSVRDLYLKLLFTSIYYTLHNCIVEIRKFAQSTFICLSFSKARC